MKRLVAVLGTMIAVAMVLGVVLVILQNSQPPVPPVALEFRTVAGDLVDGLTQLTDPRTGQPLFVSEEVLLSNDDVKVAKMRRLGASGPSIDVLLTDEASPRFADITERMIGKKIAIFIDGELVAAPTVQSRITSAIEISGDFTDEEAERIAEGINAAAR